MIALITFKSLSFMFGSDMNINVASGGCFEITLITIVANAFVNRLFMVFKAFENCSFEITLLTFVGIMGSMQTFNVSP